MRHSSRSVLRRLPVLLVGAALVPGLAACGGDDGDTTSTTTEAATTATTDTTPETTETDAEQEAGSESGCRTVSAPEPRSGEPDTPKPSQARLAGAWTVKVATNCGAFTVRLDTKRQPKTAASFKSLAEAGFYDGLTFHRIAQGFVIQGGDPQGTGSGGPGYSVRETPPNDATYTRGVVAMAKAGPEPAGTSGSQFFVVTGEDAGLPPEYAIVGRVVAGMDAVDAISDVGSSGPPNDEALEPIVIRKATVKRG